MNKKTTLSKFPELKEKWNQYIKQFPQHPSRLAIISDYCIHDNNKPNDVLSFSICPYPEELLFISSEIEKIMKKDIKHKKNISPQMINYIKQQKLIFTISYVIRNKNCVSIQKFKDSINDYINKCKNIPNKCPNNRLLHDIKNLEKINTYLKKKKPDLNFIKGFFLIASLTAEIMEFLAISYGAKEINWISDRDPATLFKQGVIFELTRILYTQKIGKRRHNTHIFYTQLDKNMDIPLENALFIYPQKLSFDNIIRFPDTITSTLASYDFEQNITPKSKHRDVLLYSLADNERICIFDLTDKEMGNLTLKRVSPVPSN